MRERMVLDTIFFKYSKLNLFIVKKVIDIDIRHCYSSETKTALNEYSWRKYARWFHRIDKSFPQYQILI